MQNKSHTIFIYSLSLCGLLGVIVANVAYAKSSVNVAAEIFNPGVVELQLQTEQWVNTNTALVTISADATLDKGNNFAQTRTQLLQKFTDLSDSSVTWNITVFNISQSDSGLEQMHVEAQARLPEGKLANLRTKTKDLSKPGLTLRLASIDFSPSLNEMETVKSNLRMTIYTEAKNEVVRINKVYPEQKYVLSSISFQPITPSLPIPLAINTMAMTHGAMGDGGNMRGGNSGGGGSNTAESTAVLAVSTKLQMNATVELASSVSAGGSGSK